MNLNAYFDCVYCINLDRRTDRMASFAEKAKQIGLQYQRVSAVDGMDAHIIAEANSKKYASPAAYACLQSHLKVLEDAQIANHQTILILEDDVLFHRKIADYDFNLTGKDWKMLYLGANQPVSSHRALGWTNLNAPLGVGLYTANQTNGTFAYAVKKYLYTYLISKLKNANMGLPIDRIYNKTVQKEHVCRVITPNLIIADVRESDIREARNQKQFAKQNRWDLTNYEEAKNVPMHPLE